MNTPNTTPEALAPEHLAELITNLTGTQWEWEHTGGGCMALVTHFPDNTYAMITDEGLSDEIAPDDAVSLGIYPDNDEHYDEAIRFTTYPTLTDLIADIAIALIDNLPEHLAWWCPTCKTTNPTTLTTCRTCQAPQH